MKRNLCALAFLVLSVISFAAISAEPNFEAVRPNVYFTNYWTGYYLEGDTPCQDSADGNNSQPGRMWDYLNAKFSDVNGEGCDYTIVRLSDGYTTDVHYQNWVRREYFCNDGYTGPYGDGAGGLECRRNPYVPVAKPPICPDCTVGNPIDITAADKVLTVEDIPNVDGLGFRRTYHSLPRSFSEGQPASLGEAWSSDHGQVLRLTPGDGPFAAKIHMVRPDGVLFLFMKSDTTGFWTSEQDDRRRFLTEITLLGGDPGYLLTLSDGTREFYDASGKHLETRLTSGQILTYEYDANGRLTKVINLAGRYIEFEYNALKRLQRVTSSSGQTVQYTYNANKILETANFGGYFEKYLYTSRSSVHSYLTRVEDGDGNEITSYTYSQGEPASTQRAGGVNRYSADYETDRWRRVISTTPLGATTNYWFRYDRGRRVVDRIENTCIGCTTTNKSFLYDANLNVIEEITGASKICKQYDLSRNLQTLAVEGASPSFDCTSMAGTGFLKKIVTTWDATYRLPTERLAYDSSSALVAKSTWTYNTRSQALTASQIDPVTSTTRTTTMTYCEQTDVTAGTCPLLGLVTSVNGPRTDVVDTATYTYYPSDDATCATAPTTCPHRKGDLWKITNALGQVTETLAYDGAGRVLSVKDANGVISDLEYHPRGWLTARKTRGANASVETDDAITRIEYWPTGLVKKVIQPDGAFTLYTYDAAHRLTDIADNAGNTIHYTLDNAGNRTQEDTKDPGNVLKRTLSRVYNQLGQLQTQADAQANPTDFAYDANGNTNTVTDALGRVTDNDYDPLNRLSRTLQNVGGINAETKFAYDAQDNLTQVTDPKGLNTTYTYNGLGDLTQLVSPDTGTTTYTYDSAGNRKTQTDARNQTSTYSYDALNRLTGIAYATSTLNVGYTYDTTQAACIAGETFSAGRLTQLADASGTTQYCYDRFGNLVRKVQTTNGIAFTVRYAYTLAGQLSSVTYPDGATASYVRDAQGRPTQVNVQRAGAASEVLLNQASYHPFGPVAGWTYGNGRQLLRPLNQNYQPTAVQDAVAGGLSVGFAYDPVGNLTQLTPAASATPLVKFDYDALSRLTTFKDGPTDVAIESYAYDATGNRQSFTNSAGTQTYTYPATSHRLSQVGATARSYDNVGNTTAIGGIAKEFVYDDTGRMSQVKQNAIVQRNYAYNGKGEQVRKYLGATNTYTVYDEAGHWLGDYDNTGAALQQAIWLDDLPVGLIANGNQLHYVEPDHLGTPRVVIEVARNVLVWTWDLKSEAFGNSVPNQDPDGDATPLVFSMRFPGQRHDAASGLNQNGYREYEPIGRYTQSDPVGLGGGISTYSYAFSNPLMWIDPDGLQVRGAAIRGPGTTGPGGAAGAYNPNNPNNVNPEVPPTNSGVDWPQIKPPEVTADGLLESLFNMSGLGTLSQIEQAISNKLNNVCEDQSEREKNCQALKDSILNTCAALTGRKKFKCFEAANTSYRQCMGYE